MSLNLHPPQTTNQGFTFEKAAKLTEKSKLLVRSSLALEQAQIVKLKVQKTLMIISFLTALTVKYQNPFNPKDKESPI